MNIPLFFGLVGLLGSIYIWIGKCASKDLQTSEDFFLMGRQLSYLPLFFTLLATQLGGGFLLGAAQEAYEMGWIVLIYPLGAFLGLLALGMGFGGRLRQLNLSTIAEIFETVYGSRRLRLIASALSIATLFFVLVAQGIASQMLFATMGVSNPLIFAVFWSVLIAYTVMGGLKAVVNTDILQALFIIFTLALAYFAIDTSTPAAPFVQSAAVSQIPWSSWLLMPFLFMFIEQDMGQRCFAAKNTKAISFASIGAGVVLLLSSVIAIYFGILAKETAIPLNENTSVLIESVKAFTNPVVATFFMAAIFMAVVSTADSMLCSISSNLACDFLPSKALGVARLFTLVVGLGSLALTYLFNNVVMMLMISYELSVCTLFVPIIAAILTARPSWIGAYLSIAFGATSFVLFRCIDISIPREVVAISLSFFGYLIGWRLTNVPEMEVQR